jgi:hypothetical protein
LNDPSHQHCCGCGAPLSGSPQVPLRRPIGEHAGETVADARRDAEAWAAAVRAARVAHHQPEAQRAREQQRAERYQADRAGIETRPAPVAVPIDDFDTPDLRSYGIGAGSSLSPHQWLAVAAGIVVTMLLCLVVFWKKDISIEVQGHTWERKISIERFDAVHDSDWCTSMPSDAYSVSRHPELHHVNHVPDGQTCRSEPGSCSTVDNGNGSGSVRCPPRRVCETKYRDVPVYENKCSYTVDRWEHVRYATASGSQLAPPPSWPTPKFESCRRTHLGCERQGPQSAEYLVHFVSNEEPARAFECDYPQAKWSSFKPDSVWAARVGVLWRRLDCDSLRRPDGTRE